MESLLLQLPLHSGVHSDREAQTMEVGIAPGGDDPNQPPNHGMPLLEEVIDDDDDNETDEEFFPFVDYGKRPAIACVTALIFACMHVPLQMHLHVPSSASCLGPSLLAGGAYAIDPITNPHRICRPDYGCGRKMYMKHGLCKNPDCEEALV